MQLTLRLKSLWESALDHDLRVQLVTMVGAIATMVILEPFNTDLWTFWEKVIYWSVCIPAGYVGSFFFERWIYPTLLRKGMKNWRPLIQIPCIVAGAMVGIFVIEAVLREPVPLRYVTYLGGYVLVVTIVLWGIVMIGTHGLSSESREKVEDEAFRGFRAQWPPELRGAQLQALSAEDHYIRLHTDAGEALIAGTFSDALKAVGQQPGTQVHRSWWVAEDAPLTLSRKGGKWELDLGEGRKAPVSRRFRPEVRAKGWDRLGA